MRCLIALPFLSLVSIGCSAQAAITLQAGTLLATDRTNNVLRQFDASTGAQIGSVQLPVAANRTLEGVTLVGSDVFVSYASTSPSLQQIARVNLQTGALSGFFAAANPVGLAGRNGEVLAINTPTTGSYSVQRFTIAGSLISTRSLTTFGTLGFQEFIDDLAWTGSRFATVSNFRLPGVGSFQVYEWDATNGQYAPPGTTIFYPHAGQWTEGFDIAPNGNYWFTYNAAQGSTAPTMIEHYDIVSGQRIMFTPPAVGALSDIVFVAIPGPSVLAAVGLAPLVSHRRRR